MTLYEQITNTIESFTESANELVIDGFPALGVRGMVDGAKYVRDNLTIEAAECVVF